MDMVGLILIVGGGAYAIFIGWLIINRPETAFKLQDRMREAQKDAEQKAGKVAKVATPIAVALLKKILK